MRHLCNVPEHKKPPDVLNQPKSWRNLRRCRCRRSGPGDRERPGRTRSVAGGWVHEKPWQRCVRRSKIRGQMRGLSGGGGDRDGEESGWVGRIHLDFGKARGPWRLARTESILVTHHRRWSPDSWKSISPRVPPGVLRSHLTVGARAFQVGMFTPDAAVGIVLGAARWHVAFGPAFRLDPAEDLAGALIASPGAGQVAEVLHR